VSLETGVPAKKSNFKFEISDFREERCKIVVGWSSRLIVRRRNTAEALRTLSSEERGEEGRNAGGLKSLCENSTRHTSAAEEVAEKRPIP
jgi:hypothetical protein